MRIFAPFILIWLIIAGLSMNVHAFGIRCLVVNSNGGVSISWDQQGINAAEFLSYYIYHSTSATGPFTAVDSVFIFNNTNRNHPSALANNNPAFYYIAFKSNIGNPDINTEVTQAIGLNVFNPSNGFANLTWNALSNPLPPTNSVWYKIYREYPAGFFTLLDSVNASTSTQPMTYSDQISICSDTIKYRIEVGDASGCKSVSNISGELFRDLQPPAQPVLDSVSLDVNGNVIIGWNVSPSPDTKEYVVLQGTATVDTTRGINSTILYSTVSATSGSLSFSAYAVDSCNNPSAPSVSHSTIFLRAIFQLCEKSVHLSWNAYSYWPDAAEYEILVSVNGGGETVAGITTELFYDDADLISGAFYCYRIRARETGGSTRSSTSNKVCVVPIFPPPPLFSYIRSVSVVGPSTVEVKAYVDAAAAVTSYHLARSNSAAGPYSVVASQPASGLSNIRFFDISANTDAFSYYYRVYSIDSCGIKVLESQTSRSILLNGTAEAEYTNYLSWIDYEEWLGTVSHYNLYIRINGVLTNTPLFTFYPGDPLFYTDTVIDDVFSDGKFCYVIEAIEAGGNPYFFLDSARSNEVCLNQDPAIFIPNAFHPGGSLNDIFYPSNGFVDTKSYSLHIFNRWGEVVFQTNNPRVGWDGSSNGKRAPEAVYIYRLIATTSDGTPIEKVGSVTLIR
jgi:gliding motility-associated-like protein